MHPYTTDSKRRITVPLLIGVISLILVQNIGILQNIFPKFWVLEGWVPSVGLVASALYVVFSRWLWSSSIFRHLGIVQVPDLNGVWEGVGKTFRPEEDLESEFETTVTIRQQWGKISIRLETANSISRSKGGILLTDEGITPTLTYHYLNEPKPSAPNTMEIHHGTTTLDYSKNESELIGRYYSDEKRRTYGELHLKRIESPSIISDIKSKISSLPS